MEPFSAIARLLGLLSVHAPSREWAFAFSALLVVWIGSELFVGRLGLHLLSVESDRGSAVVVLLAGMGGVGLAFVAANVRWLPIYEAWARWLGLGVMVAGLALRVFAILWLGPMFTRFVQILPGHRLVTSGPYRFVRHPSYSGLLLFFVGMSVALGDWVSVLLLMLVPFAGVWYRIRVEEEALLGAFGGEYRTYMGHVRSLLPFIF
jgi:protein-S-isoprenylcysteine O-methyltransferase Ste14